MQDFNIILYVFAAFVVLVVGGIIFGIIAQRKRRNALSQWAARHDLRFFPTRNRSFDERFVGFSCLRQGRSRYAYNCVTGQWRGREMICFDYRYVTGSGKSRSSHTFSAVILHAKMPLKPLLIRHENMLDKVAELFGHDDINFESAEFSRRFFVKSSDRKWAYDVLSTRTIEFLLQSPPFSIAFDPLQIIAWRSGRFHIPEFEQAIAVIEGILDRLPDYLVQQQQVGV